MKSWVLLASVALAVPVAALAFEGDTPTVKSVMAKLHKGSKSGFAVLKKQSEATPPDWAAIGKTTKDFVILGASLEKNEPSKGDKDSWKKLADKYFADSKALDDAATAKDLAALQAAQKVMGASCKACHTAHRGEH